MQRSALAMQRSALRIGLDWIGLDWVGPIDTMNSIVDLQHVERKADGIQRHAGRCDGHRRVVLRRPAVRRSGGPSAQHERQNPNRSSECVSDGANGSNRK